MPFDIGDVYNLINILIFAVGGLVFICLWYRTRFWIPAYIHIMAAIAFIIGIWISKTAPDNAPAKQDMFLDILIILFFPAVVYIFFIINGGQYEAFARRKKSFVF
jgi:hypothetical protein